MEGGALLCEGVGGGGQEGGGHRRWEGRRDSTLNLPVPIPRCAD